MILKLTSMVVAGLVMLASSANAGCRNKGVHARPPLGGGC